PPERAGRITRLLEFLESQLQRTDIDFTVQVFWAVSHLWHRPHTSAPLWEWFREYVLSVRDQRTLEAICISCLEPLPDEPVDLANLDQLFGMMDDDRRSYLVFCAYEVEGFPENLFADYAAYVDRCRSRG